MNLALGQPPLEPYAKPTRRPPPLTVAAEDKLVLYSLEPFDPSIKIPLTRARLTELLSQDRNFNGSLYTPEVKKEIRGIIDNFEKYDLNSDGKLEGAELESLSRLAYSDITPGAIIDSSEGVPPTDPAALLIVEALRNDPILKQSFLHLNDPVTVTDDQVLALKKILLEILKKNFPELSSLTPETISIRVSGAGGEFNTCSGHLRVYDKNNNESPVLNIRISEGTWIKMHPELSMAYPRVDPLIQELKARWSGKNQGQVSFATFRGIGDVNIKYDNGTVEVSKDGKSVTFSYGDTKAKDPEFFDFLVRGLSRD